MIQLFVPGRLCLFGEHSDWAGGHRVRHPEIAPGRCLVAATDQGLHAVAERRTQPVVEFFSRLPNGARETATVRLDDCDRVARAGGFWSYAAGVVAELGSQHPIGGARIAIERTDLPIQRGLSSSAALCVLVARAYSRLYDLDLTARAEMEIAYRGERRTGSECGRMDQVSALGPGVSLLTFDGDDLLIEPVAVGAGLPLLIVDLRARKDTRRILADLNACFPDVTGPTALAVRDALGERNLALVACARAAVIAGDGSALGDLMREAQALFDTQVAPACPELRAPRLHAVLEHPAVLSLAWGGKGVGSQGDGCAQIVARGVAERTALARALAADLGVSCIELTLGA